MTLPTRGFLGTIFAAALVAAVVVLLASVQGAESARAADDPDNNGGRVVGGTAVPDGKYRFIAALRDTQLGSTAYQQQFCGGTLIDEDSVLTAAHCVDGRLSAPLRVTVGRTVLDSDQGKTRHLSNIFVHPRYNGSFSRAYDAAVLALRSPVSGIAPIKLATTSQNSLETPGRQATVAGWGNTVAQPPGGGGGNNFPQRMREAQVPIVSDTKAKQVYGSSYVSSLMVAAGRTGKDTCQGDSGGPMFTKVSGKFTQIGITSFGAGCGANGFPGVYAEVNASSIRNFITNAASE